MSREQTMPEKSMCGLPRNEILKIDPWNPHFSLGIFYVRMRRGYFEIAAAKKQVLANSAFYEAELRRKDGRVFEGDLAEMSGRV